MTINKKSREDLYKHKVFQPDQEDILRTIHPGRLEFTFFLNRNSKKYMLLICQKAQNLAVFCTVQHAAINEDESIEKQKSIAAQRVNSMYFFRGHEVQSNSKAKRKLTVVISSNHQRSLSWKCHGSFRGHKWDRNRVLRQWQQRQLLTIYCIFNDRPEYVAVDSQSNQFGLLYS